VVVLPFISLSTVDYTLGGFTLVPTLNWFMFDVAKLFFGITKCDTYTNYG
jgi:hypothetical protein